MEEISKKRVLGLRIMYSLTIAVAGVCGVGMLAAPGFTEWLFGQTCPRAVSGLAGSVFIAFAVLSALGLRQPLKFAPVLLLQLLYKTAWLFCVAPPLFIADGLSADIVPVAAVFAAVAAGDIAVIPFARIFRK